jgi:hypothetical protein
MRLQWQSRYKGIHTSAVVGARVLAGAVLLALTTPLRRSGRGKSDSSQEDSSSVGKHVAMLHNRTMMCG